MKAKKASLNPFYILTNLIKRSKEKREGKRLNDLIRSGAFRKENKLESDVANNIKQEKNKTKRVNAVRKKNSLESNIANNIKQVTCDIKKLEGLVLTLIQDTSIYNGNLSNYHNKILDDFSIVRSVMDQSNRIDGRLQTIVNILDNRNRLIEEKYNGLTEECNALKKALSETKELLFEKQLTIEKLCSNVVPK